jgi:hypothetical protein
MNATTVTLGALADPLTKQLDGLILPATLAHLDADANAITRLVVRGYLPDSQAHRAREKLMKKIREEASKSAKHLGRSNNCDEPHEERK